MISMMSPNQLFLPLSPTIITIRIGLTRSIGYTFLNPFVFAKLTFVLHMTQGVPSLLTLHVPIPFLFSHFPLSFLLFIHYISFMMDPSLSAGISHASMFLSLSKP